MSQSASISRAARGGVAFLAGLVLVLGLIVVAVLGTADETGFNPVEHDNPVLDLLGWIPATEASLRRFSAWSAQPGDPLNLTEALDALGLEPRPLATGRSAEWQRIVGMDASQVTGWASAPDDGITILEGTFYPADVVAALRAAGYARLSRDDVSIWTAPDGVAKNQVIAGDDLRALTAIAVVGDRLVAGLNPDDVVRALDAASGHRESLADSDEVNGIVSASTAGLVVVDQRDLAIDCGVAGQWTRSDFSEPSGLVVALVYQRGEEPRTTVRVQYPDELAALAGLTTLEREWAEGYLNQRGVAARVTDIGTVRTVETRGEFVVADLVQGRDNGWTRSGVRFLIGICEQASTLVPAGAPERATPAASPSPVEQP